MLLDGLTKDEKRSFWNIANVVAAADGSISEEESILKQYTEEMGGDYEFIDPSSVDIENELNKFKTSELKTRKIVYFELYSVAYADTEFDVKEQELMNKIFASLAISGDDRDDLEDCVKTIFGAYRKLGDVLNA